MIRLVLGGARSGKSRFAQALVEELAGKAGTAPVLVATAEALDDEMHERIRRHQADRDGRWQTIEAPRDLAAVLAGLPAASGPVLVDCLTLWLTNVLLANVLLAAAPLEQATATEAAIIELVDVLTTAGADITLVANEVGLGIVPDNALARQFRDHAGRLNQMVAAVADRVTFIAAGLPLVLKPQTPS
jgi:adenosylcobinamide kinase/adenosylcobinamide-phosphate guanylyltransferase